MKLPAAGVALMAAALGGCRSGPVRSKPNVVLVTLDTLRPDRLGCYGYGKIETPHLDRLAQRGVLFENAVAQAPLTAPSHASMMTGVNPTVHRVRDTGGFVLAPDAATLAETLAQQGWETAAFIGSSVLKRRFGLDQGFAVYDDEMPRAPQSSDEAAERRAEEVVDRALQWLEARTGKPFFLWVHVFDPHLPYDPPPGFREKYADNLYDGEIAYTDQQVGRLLDGVWKKSPPGNTLIFVLSDHGEAFGENGEYAHGVFLYDTTLRIAFLAAGPGIPAGLRIRQQARTIDLFPTLLELVGVRPPPGVEGVSLVPAFQGKEVSTHSYAETLFPRLNMGWAELRGIRTSRWKYIRAPRPELYDLAQDPNETRNVVSRHPAEAAELEARLNVMAGAAEKVEPASVDARTLRQLKSLGYLGGYSGQPQTLTGRGVDPKDRTEVLKLLHFGVNSDLPAVRRIAMLRRAIAEDPANPSLYSNLGNVLAAEGRIPEAMKLYQDALGRGVRAAWLFSRLGSLCLRQGKTNDAVPLLEAAAQMNPYDFDSLQNLAAAYRVAGRLADAEAVLNAIVKSGEDYAPAYNELGMVWHQKGDLTAALGYFEKAARLDPVYQLNLGRLYKSMGDKARARACLEAFLAARGSSPAYSHIAPEVKKELAGLE